MKKVLILGATGLIGHQVFLRLKARKDYEVISFAHQRKIDDDTVLLNARDEQLLEKKIVEVRPDIIVNSMGALIAEANRDPESAIFLNAYIPQRLKTVANRLGAKLVHISTDCVFSGKKGSYIESDIKDADDTYGRAKAMGEVVESPHVTLRTSVVGPEIKDGEELFHWFMKQAGEINGFTKSFWSGVTTLELAKAVEWAIERNIQGLYHITNGQPINKYALLILFKKHTKKALNIVAVDGPITDKSFLDTRQEIEYSIPSYDEMVCEMVYAIKNNPALYTQYAL
jgi:dTDP-4-dehydrorhamnose reductase|tara:strand:+ start:112 stop:966 length:855 start_codon:yes stop_codon:yes gene_type:complete